MRPDIRIRIRRRIIRIRVTETCIRSIIRITATKESKAKKNKQPNILKNMTGCYAPKKQRRDPTFAAADDGDLCEYEQPKPAAEA